MASFGKRALSHARSDARPLAAASMEQALHEAERTDPLARLKAGAGSLKTGLYSVFQQDDDSGIHVDSVLGVLGSLAGFACVFGIYHNGRLKPRPDDVQDVLEVKSATGQKFYFGNLINGPLIENRMSVWNLVSGTAEDLGCAELPDIEEITKHTAGSVGGANFGVPRLPPEHGLSDVPAKYVKYLWPKVYPDFRARTKDAEDIPILIGFAIQDVMDDAKDIIDPGMAAQIVMECAVPMSKIDPATAF